MVNHTCWLVKPSLDRPRYGDTHQGGVRCGREGDRCFFDGGWLTDHMRYGCIVCKYAYTNIGVYIYICTYMQEQSYNIYVCHIVLCDLYVTSNKYDY